MAKTTPQRHAQLVRESQKRYRNRFLARKAVSKKVKRGLIPPAKTLKCSDCPSPATEYDHPRGYDTEHRFDIEPVCKDCHIKRGKLRKEHRNQHTTIKPELLLLSEEERKAKKKEYLKNYLKEYRKRVVDNRPNHHKKSVAVK